MTSAKVLLIAAFGLLAQSVAGYANNGAFNFNQYPQAQVNAWTQACRSFQAQALATQAQQNQFFANMFPAVQLPPLPFTDVCSQAGYGSFGGAGGVASAGTFSHGGAGVTSFNNRFGGDDGYGSGGGGGVHGVSISSSTNGHGQGGTVVSHYGNGGATTNYIPHGQHQSSFSSGGNGGGYATANRFGGGGSGQGVSVSSFGTNNGGQFASANRFGGSTGGHGGTTHYVSTSNGGGTVGSYGPNGGSFASASRFGGGTSGGYSGNGIAVGTSVSSTSNGNGGGSVQTSVYKQHY